MLLSQREEENGSPSLCGIRQAETADQLAKGGTYLAQEDKTKPGLFANL